MSFSNELSQAHETVYQLVCTPEIVKSEDAQYRNVYSLLRLDLFDDTVKADILYDVSRIDTVAKSILQQVESGQPSSDEFAEFVSELL